MKSQVFNYTLKNFGRLSRIELIGRLTFVQREQVAVYVKVYRRTVQFGILNTLVDDKEFLNIFIDIIRPLEPSKICFSKYSVALLNL